jgi:protein SCO1/2
MTQPTATFRQAGRTAHPRWMHGLYTVLGGLAAAVLVFAVLRPVQVLPRGAALPAFHLVDADGRGLTEWDALGAPTLFQLGYAGCGAACAPAEAALRAVQARLDAPPEGGLPVRFVTVSLDPADDRAALQRYAARLGAAPGRWRVAGGDPAQVRQLVGAGFGIYYTTNGEMRFEPATVLVDERGLIRAVYRGAAPDPAVVLRDLRLLGDERRNSAGAGRLVYEAAHLFLCYPR